MKHQRVAYLISVVLLLALAACQPLILPEFPPAAIESQSTSAPSVQDATTDSPTPAASNVVNAAPGADTLGDSIYPGMGNGGYDVIHYTLNLNVDVPNNLLDATAIIDATSTQALSAFNLDFHGLTITQVTVNGVEATFSRNGDELTITPAIPLPESTPFTTLIAYNGSPQPIADPSAPTNIGWNFTGNTIYVVSEPAGAKTWFPNNNHPRDKATYTIQITADSAYTASATGRLVSTSQNGDTTTALWEMNDPMATYLSAIYIGDFVREESQGPGGLLIRNYFPPNMQDREKEPFNQTAQIIEFYNNLFGPYPFEVYGSIVIDEPLGYALENQTLSIHGRDTTDIYVLAHEIMHQWTGNHVSPGDWQDIWLNEGFAFYLPFLYLDSTGAVDIDSLMSRFYTDLQSRGSIGSATVAADQLFDSTSVYRRGGLTLYALHQQVGDAPFKSIMRRYYEQFGGRAATTSDFIAVAESIGGSEVRPLLNAWLYEDGLPELP